MKELSEAELKEIAYNCRRDTFLIEKQQVGKLSLREETELKTHLSGCSICVTFMQQSEAINQMAKKIFYPDYRVLKLDDRFKDELQLRIIKKLDKN